MLLILPAVACTLLMLVHSLYIRPLRANLFFILLAYPISMYYGGAHLYVFNMPQPVIYHFIDANRSYPIPVLNMIGFLFTFYSALMIAIHFMERIGNKREVPYFKLLFASVYFSATIGIAIEFTNMAAQWWSWSMPVGMIQLFGVWCWRSMMLFSVFFLCFIPKRTRPRRDLFLLLSWVIFYMIWMIYVDYEPVLQFLAIVLFVLLPILALKVPGPIVNLELIQFNRPMPFRKRKSVK